MTPDLARALRRAVARPSVVRTEAVVLRVHPFSRTSHLVVWLTREGLRLATSVKGAARPDSPFLGQYDLYYACDLLYYARARDGVHVARECEPLRRRDALRTNWRAEHCASWFAALANLVSDAGAPFPGLYRLLDETLDVLAALPGAPSPALFARYEAKLLAEAGLRPNFDLPPGSRPGSSLRFHLADGRAIPDAPASDPLRLASLASSPSGGAADPLRLASLASSPSGGASFAQGADPRREASAPSLRGLPAKPGGGVIQHSAFSIQHSTGSPEPVVRLPAPAAALFDELADSPSIGPGSTHARLAPRAVGPLLRFLGLFLRYHLPDAPLEGRALALAALAASPSRPDDARSDGLSGR